jgi:hypothetical protein
MLRALPLKIVDKDYAVSRILAFSNFAWQLASGSTARSFGLRFVPMPELS